MHIYFAGTYQPTPQEQAFGHALHWVLFVIFTLVFGYFFLRYIKTPSNIRFSRIIRTSRWVAPVVGVLLGIVAFLANDNQVPYLLWYPFFVTMTLEAALSLWTKYQISVYERGQPSSRRGMIVFGMVTLALVGAVAFGVFKYVDGQHYKKRIENFNACMYEHYGDHDTHDSSPCLDYIRTKWGF